MVASNSNFMPASVSVPVANFEAERYGLGGSLETRSVAILRILRGFFAVLGKTRYGIGLETGFVMASSLLYVCSAVMTNCR